ncbi:MAG: hypothetical protein JWL70_3194 [Acidimicrobiia bacterium]|nr:hypothetical protein [Acidimicrobiia bacterium]
MIDEAPTPVGNSPSAPDASDESRRLARYASYFQELDAWTEYWDIYHPESRGRYSFGDGVRPGLLAQIVPRDGPTPVFTAWRGAVLGQLPQRHFAAEVRVPAVAEAVCELDDLMHGLVDRHFGDLRRPGSRLEYLDAVFRFATDTLPAASDRASLLPHDDPRRARAARHTVYAEDTWFVWALLFEAAQIVDPDPAKLTGRSLLLAGAAMGCSFHFAWRGGRPTRPEYQRNERTRLLLMSRALEWSSDFAAGAEEVHHLYCIGERGGL